MDLMDICARAQSWAIFVAKDFSLAKHPAVLPGLALKLRRQPTFFETVQCSTGSLRATVRAHTVSKSIDFQASEGFTRQLHNFSFENNHWPIEKSKNRQKEKESGRKTQQENPRGGKKWANFTVVLARPRPGPDALSLTQTVTGTLKHVKSSVARTGGIVLRWSSGYGAGG